MRERVTDWTATVLMIGLLPVLIFVLAGVTLAAKPSRATLSVTPNHASAWSTATGSGCGYAADDVYVDIQKPEALAFFSVAPDANGCISFVFNTDGPGAYVLETRQSPNGKTWRTLASYSLPVE
jgi:hypothetical protein